MTSILWLRRDLRRADHPALAAAAADGPVHPVFVLDPALWTTTGDVRPAWLAANLRALDERLEGNLALRHGDPRSVIPRLVEELGATSVHVSTETTPFGVRRDEAVRAALPEGVEWVETGSPYAVTPGRVTKKDGTAFLVFTPFSKAWKEHGWREPCEEPADLELADAGSHDKAETMLDAALERCPVDLPPAGEEAALARWREFLDVVGDYKEDRNRPDLDGTSRLSPYLKYGVVHPRTLLADLAPMRSKGAEHYVSELAWREFYGDVLARNPESAWSDLKPLGIDYDSSDSDFAAWREGRTGYPVVDAGMRELAATGWMHNRARMIVASFLTKDLHQWWPDGARHFLDHLLDGDVASNNHGWQWTAGTGTDAAPYFRVFNPVTQGLRFDPQGDYVRRWVPELAHLQGKAAHEPWDHEDGYAHDYPQRIVDHAAERTTSLHRYEHRKKD